MNRLDYTVQDVLSSLWRKADDKAARYGFERGCRDRDEGMAFDVTLPSGVHQSFAPSYARGYWLGFYGIDDEPEF